MSDSVNKVSMIGPHPCIIIESGTRLACRNCKRHAVQLCKPKTTRQAGRSGKSTTETEGRCPSSSHPKQLLRQQSEVLGEIATRNVCVGRRRERSPGQLIAGGGNVPGMQFIATSYWELTRQTFCDEGHLAPADYQNDSYYVPFKA
eukprot:151475-Amphidinium_carterae.1